MENIYIWLYTFEKILLYPVVLLLIGLFLWSWVELGWFLREWLERKGLFFAKKSIFFSQELTLEEFEYLARHQLSRHLLFSKLGPMLGLMGTLIPLGPALLALSKGDTELLSKNLIIAFGTTVLGLFISSVHYTLYLIRRSFYAKDILEWEIKQRKEKNEPIS